jgi:hypothetical protein
MKDENELDQFFKKGLAEPDLPFNELDWEKMEEKLGPRKSKRSVLLWPIAAAGIAASIFLIFFLLFQKEDSIPFKDKTDSKAPVDKPSVGLKEQPLNKKQDVLVAKTKAERELVTRVSVTIKERNLPLTQQSIAIIKNNNPTSIASLEITKPKSIESIDTVTRVSSVIEVPMASPRTKRLMQKSNHTGHLSFSVIAAPDISSSQGNFSSKLSTNLGLLATYSITKNISLTTGVIYARKLYEYSGASISAYGSLGKTMETYADCKVLDIPLNLNYRVYEKGLNSISLNTGLSSYIMLNEEYKYVSNDGLGNTNSSVLEIVNQNQHFLGVANIGISFNRKINNQVSVGIQPFVKIPLTGIGYHDSKLKSTGIAFSLNLNMRHK